MRATTGGAGHAAVTLRPGFAPPERTRPGRTRPGRTRPGRIRLRLSGAFFPVDQTAVPGWVLAVITVGCAALALGRLGSAGISTFWAEDGQILYQGALTHPLHAYVETYRGYLITAPRVVATVVALFPVSQAAAANAVADAIALGLFAALIYRASGEHVRNPWLRAFPAVVTVACPLGQETWGSTANLQWPMFLVAFVVLLWNPRRPVPIAVGALSVVLLALTTPFGLLLAPLAVARVVALGRDRGLAIPLAFLAGVAVQGVVMAVVHDRRTSSTFLPGVIERRYTAFIAGQGFLGAQHPLPWQRLGTAVVIAVLAALVLVAASGRLRQCAVAALALAYSIGYFAVLTVLTGGAGEWGFANRYNVGPFLLLGYAVTVLFDASLPGAAGQRAGRARAEGQRRLASLPRFASLALCAALAWPLAWTVSTSWHVRDPWRQQPTWASALATARAECGGGARTVQVPITPPNTGYHWHVTLTCAQLK
jgi:hypothetical protein